MPSGPITRVILPSFDGLADQLPTMVSPEPGDGAARCGGLGLRLRGRCCAGRACAWLRGVRLGELLEELGGELVRRLKGRDASQLVGSGVDMPLGQVVIRQHEVAGDRVGLAFGIVFKGPELSGVDIDVGIEAYQGRPVPSRTVCQYRVEWRRGLLELSQREEYQRAEFVEAGVVWHGLRAPGR